MPNPPLTLAVRCLANTFALTNNIHDVIETTIETAVNTRDHRVRFTGFDHQRGDHRVLRTNHVFRTTGGNTFSSHDVMIKTPVRFIRRVMLRIDNIDILFFPEP